MKLWSKDETQKLIRARQGEYPDPWSKLAKALNRTVDRCKAKYKCVKKKNLKAKWTRDELDLLKKCLGQYTVDNFTTISWTRIKKLIPTKTLKQFKEKREEWNRETATTKENGKQRHMWLKEEDMLLKQLGPEKAFKLNPFVSLRAFQRRFLKI